MSVRAFALALAILAPSITVSAAPEASQPSNEGKAQAGAGKQRQREQGPGEDRAQKRDGRSSQGKKARSKADLLRERCYGGQEKKLPPIVMEARNRELLEATRRQEGGRAARAAKALLQGGDEDLALLEVYKQALEASEVPEEREAAKACGELIKLFFPG